MPEVRIVVRQESQGTALRDAARDANALENNRGRTVDYAALQRQRDEARKAVDRGDTPAPDDPKQRLRKAAVNAELAATQARAGGDDAGAAQLERKAEVLRRTLGLQQQLGVSEAQARVLASQSLSAEEKIAAGKSAAAKASKDSAAEDHVGRKREIFGDEIKAKELRADGDHKGAEVLERQNAIRSRAIQIERELGLSRKESAALATREVDASIAVQKRGGGSGQGGGALGQIINPATLLATAATAIATKTYRDTTDFFDTKNQEKGNAERNASRRRQIRFGTFGDSDSEREEEAVSGRKQNKQELDDALAAKGTFKNSITSNIFTLGGLLGERDGDAAERKNDEKIARLKSEKPAAEKLALQEFKTGQGGRELELGRRNAVGDRAGARRVEQEIAWWGEYDRLKNKLGEGNVEGEAIARESANNKVAVIQRQQNQKFAGLLNARSGAGDIARVAALTSGGIRSYGSGGDAAEAVKTLTQRVTELHLDTKSHMPSLVVPRADLRGRPL